MNQPPASSYRPGHSQEEKRRSALSIVAPGSVGGFFASKSMDAMFEELVGSIRDGNLTAAGLKSWLTEQHQRIKGSSAQAHHSKNSASSLFACDCFEVDEVRAFLSSGRPPLKAIDDDSNPVLVEKEDAILENLVLSKPGLQRLLRFFSALGFDWNDPAAGNGSAGLGAKARSGGAVSRDAALQIFRRIDTDGDGWVCRHLCVIPASLKRCAFTRTQFTPPSLVVAGGRARPSSMAANAAVGPS